MLVEVVVDGRKELKIEKRERGDAIVFKSRGTF